MTKIKVVLDDFKVISRPQQRNDKGLVQRDCKYYASRVIGIKIDDKYYKILKKQTNEIT